MRNFYSCGHRFDTDYLDTLMNTQDKKGKVIISSKEAKILTIQGEYENLEYRLTSGISGQHSKGGQSSERFKRKREEEVKFFFKKVHSYMKRLDVTSWIIEGEKEIVKKFKR